MVAGLPGTGIGGIFYLLGVACMPIREAQRLLRGKSSRKRWALITRQWGLSLGIMAGFWMMGYMLTIVLPSSVQHAVTGTTSHNVLKIKPFVISLTVLLSVLSLVEISRLFIPKPTKIA
jgi:hypothetical protein